MSDHLSTWGPSERDVEIALETPAPLINRWFVSSYGFPPSAVVRMAFAEQYSVDLPQVGRSAITMLPSDALELSRLIIQMVAGQDAAEAAFAAIDKTVANRAP